VRQDNLGRVIGNKSASTGDVNGKGLYAHTWVGNEDSEPFSDLDAVSTAIQSSKPEGSPQPDFEVFGYDGFVAGLPRDTKDVLNDPNVWATNESQSVRSLLERIFSPRRNIPAWLDYIETGDNGSTDPADFIPIIQVGFGFLNSIDRQLPSGEFYRVLGAQEASVDPDGQQRYIALDVTNDHRLGPNAPSTFGFNDDGFSRYDKLTTRSERITIVITVGQGGILEARWTAQEAAALDDLDPETDYEPTRFDHVYRDYGFPLDWDWSLDGTQDERVDYRITFNATDNSNTLEVPAASVQDTSPFALRVLDYVPFYKGIDYSVQPPEPQSETTGEDQKEYNRDTVGILTFDTSGLDAAATQGAQVSRAGNQGNDLRINAAVDELSEIPALSLKLTIAIQNGHRLEWSEVRLGEDGNPIPEAEIARTKFVDVPGLALHLGKESTRFRTSDETDTLPEGPGGGPPILRDDRDTLVKRHSLAQRYYLVDRRPLRLQLLTVGGHPLAIKSEVVAYTDFSGATVEGNEGYRFPNIGDFVTTITYNGRKVDVNGTVTSYVYDRQNGTVDIQTDYGQRDLV